MELLYLSEYLHKYNEWINIYVYHGLCDVSGKPSMVMKYTTVILSVRN